MSGCGARKSILTARPSPRTAVRPHDERARMHDDAVARKLRLVAATVPAFLRESTRRTIAKHLFRVATRSQLGTVTNTLVSHTCDC